MAKKHGTKNKTKKPLARIHSGQAKGSGQGKPNQKLETFAQKRRKALKLYISGKSLNDIATALGVSYEAVVAWKEKYAWNEVLEMAEEEFKSRLAVQAAKKSIQDVGAMADVTEKLLAQAEAVPLTEGSKVDAYREGRQWVTMISTINGKLTAAQAASLNNGTSITQILANAAKRAEKAGPNQ